MSERRCEAFVVPLDLAARGAARLPRDVEAHLRGCVACREASGALTLAAAAEALAMSEAPAPGGRDRLLAALAAPPPRPGSPTPTPRRRRGLAALAGAVAAGLLATAAWAFGGTLAVMEGPAPAARAARLHTLALAGELDARELACADCHTARDPARFRRASCADCHVPERW